MKTSGDQRVVPGIMVSVSGEATVDRSMSEVLFDLALQLEDPTKLPVDVQHVLAAIVLAARSGELDPDTPLSANDHGLLAVLTPPLERFGL